MGPKKSDKVRKLLPMKVPYEELQPFSRELGELRLEFLFWNWNWNCVSASICKEIMDKNVTEGVKLRGDERMEDSGLHKSEEKGDCVGNYAHLATSTYDVCDGLAGALVNHLTLFLVIFYRGMGLLTKKEEKRFPKEQEIWTAESKEGTENDISQPSIPPQTTARGPVQVEVVRRRESQRDEWRRERE
ncbi:hypothetical protein AXG93_1748s1110 [Marchantia polymorpha subsp. ruderalis]|uniref:Uncharacterized protein n=1 Tax=Marchantia polymorpha subsp. ruderalis TaxID=1480154 RepID=A0A176VM15_MARPO|nr:hypothetical protein AXG93_1748s1110 [Marchantia polymorpha subsp. ruderalis]